MVELERVMRRNSERDKGIFRGRSPSVLRNAEAESVRGGRFFCSFPFVQEQEPVSAVRVHTKDFGAEAGYGRDANMGLAESTWR